MAEYLWVPCEDKQWDAKVYEITADLGYLALARAPNSPYANHYGNWGAIKSGDTLMIAAHGLPKSADKIGWQNKANAITFWTPTDLARELRKKLTSNQREMWLTVRLLACWGGDTWMGKEAFGGKLASLLGTAGMNGQVHAYKGKVIIGGTKRLLVKGSGRFTSIFGGNFTKGELNKAIPDSLDDEVTVGKFNLYDSRRQQVTWPIPK